MTAKLPCQRYLRLVAEADDAVARRDFRAFRRAMAALGATWREVRQELAATPVTETPLAPAAGQLDDLARKLRDWQQETATRLTQLRRQRQGRRRLAGAYRQSGPRGRNVMLNIG